MNKYVTPIKSIRKHCLQCSGGSVKEVRECVIHQCVLYNFRMGKNPRRKGINRKKRVVDKSV
jgi:hypothetical protein